MTLCDNDHDEVCYECRSCPVCAAITEIKDLETEAEGLNGQVEDLERQLNEALT